MSELENQIILDNFQQWFNEYVEVFCINEPENESAMQLKKDHTIRVVNEIEMLSKALDLCEKDITIAKITALFHDIGRFEQYAKYKTFNDSISENHASLSLKQIHKHKVLSKFIKNDSDTKQLILKTIGYHNVAKLPFNENKKILFFAKLLRDADKLDIWKVVIKHYYSKNNRENKFIELGFLDNSSCSEKVIKSLKNKSIVFMKDLQTVSDFKLFQLGWVFDLNFSYTIEAVRKRGYIQQIAETLPKSQEINDAVQTVMDYINN